MTTRQLTDKAEIQAYLETDCIYAAYALGDLDEGFFGECTWYVAEEGSAVRALALVYAGFDPPILFLMGEVDGVTALLEEPVQLKRACPMAREEHSPVLEKYYQWRPGDLWLMWRMALRPADFRPVDVGAVRARLLTQADVDRLGALYTLGGGDAFTAMQLVQGVFYGIEQSGHLVAAAGTHLVSQVYSVAAVGNVMTHPNYRGRGYATLATSAVCAELIRRGIATIVLNVGQDNLAAIRVYKKLGFVRHCTFYEGLIERQ